MSDDWVDAAGVIVDDWLAHLGYEPDEIAEANTELDHSECEITEHGWDCTDGDGDYRHHAVHVEADAAAELVMFTLQHHALAGLLLLPGGEVREETSWSHRDGTDCTSPEYCGVDSKRVTRRITEWPDGTELMTPWRPVDTEAVAS
jgi:hypothetical protein